MTRTSLKGAMPTMNLLREIHVVMDVEDCDKSMMCAVFEDNNGAIKLEKIPTMRPRTKHEAINHIHFLSFVAKGYIKMIKEDTTEQETYFLRDLS